MITVTIAETFEGYPNGTRKTFVAGETVEVSDEFGRLIVDKGHARETEKHADAPAAKAKKGDAK